MELAITDTISPLLSTTFATFLNGQEHTQNELYIVVGNSRKIRWSIYVSVIGTQVAAMLEKIIPFLMTTGCTFEIVKDQEAAELLLSGNAGYCNIGKIVCVYPLDDRQALQIAEKLIPLTRGFRGPDIPRSYWINARVYVSMCEANGEEQPLTEKGLLKFFLKTFKLPSGTSWPFAALAPYKPSTFNRFLGGRYFVLRLLKTDAKGNVYKVIYLNGLRLRLAVIKEGKRGMMPDDHGRDAAARVECQYLTHTSIADGLPIPAAVDYFTNAEACYLVLRYYKITDLTAITSRIYEGRGWHGLTDKDRLSLVDLFAQVVELIETTHAMGYLHRDIAPGNVALDRKGNMMLTDLELTYNTTRNWPLNAFGTGTQGFVSPNQQAGGEPAAADDIYSLIALGIFCLTGLHPLTFSNCNRFTLIRRLLFFQPDRPAVALLLRGLDAAYKRPSLPVITDDISRFRARVAEGLAVPVPRFDRVEVAAALVDGLEGLFLKRMFNPAGLWLTPDSSRLRLLSNQETPLTVQPGLYDGVSGVLFVCFQALKLGVKFRYSAERLTNNIDYLLTQEADGTRFGLADSPAGIAVALHEGLKGMVFLEQTKLIADKIRDLLRIPLPEQWGDPGIYGGAAGYALALVNCRSVLFAGNWPYLRAAAGFVVNKYKNISTNGIAHGRAGALLFLMAYYQLSEEDSLLRTILELLADLQKQTKKRQQSAPWLMEGNAGIALVFIQAYKLFKDATHRKTAMSILDAYPYFLTGGSFSHWAGLAGLGEVYLEAAQVLEVEAFNKRAEWLAAVLCHTLQTNQGGGGYWLTNGVQQPHPGFAGGAAGIIHFLMRVCYPGRLHFPFLPIEKILS